MWKPFSLYLSFPLEVQEGKQKQGESNTLGLYGNNWNDKAILLLHSIQKSAGHLGLG